MDYLAGELGAFCSQYKSMFTPVEVAGLATDIVSDSPQLLPNAQIDLQN